MEIEVIRGVLESKREVSLGMTSLKMKNKFVSIIHASSWYVSL